MSNPCRHLIARLLLLTLLIALTAPAVVSHAATPLSPLRGGTLVDGLLVDPDSLLPNFSRSFYSLLVQQVLFAPLLYSDDHGIIQPGLASNVPTLQNGGISQDGRTYIFHLRPGLLWSDGTPLTARDVDFSWRLWTTNNVNAASTLGFDRIGAATISVDGLTITFRLVQPYAPFLSDWTDTPGILPVHKLGQLATKDVAGSIFAQAPNVNSGPFMLSDVSKGDHITVVRNPHYYRAAEGFPYLDEIIFRTIPNQTHMLNALRTHKVDTAWLLPITSLGALRGMRNVTLLALDNASWEAAFLNLRHPVFQDLRVRLALEYGLNRNAEVQNIWHGLATLIGSDQPPSSPVYASDVTAYPYNPRLASTLLEQAGWHLGADGYRHKGNQILSLTYSSTFNNPWRQADEVQALSDYERLGIQLVIRNYPAAIFANQILPSGAFDLAEYVVNNVLDPDNTALFGTRFSAPAGYNYCGYSNPEFDRLAGLEVSTVDPIQRLGIFHRLQQILHNDLPALWLYSPKNLAAANKRVHNYHPSPYSLETWNAWQWYVAG